MASGKVSNMKTQLWKVVMVVFSAMSICVSQAEESITERFSIALDESPEPELTQELNSILIAAFIRYADPMGKNGDVEQTPERKGTL